MADNETDGTKLEETSVAADEPSLTGDQNFAYWLTMLPFIGLAVVFLYEFSKTPGEYNKLYNAAGAVVVGIFVAALVNALSGDKKDDSTVSEGVNPEGSS